MKYVCQVRKDGVFRIYLTVNRDSLCMSDAFSCIETGKVIKIVVGRNTPLFLFLPI